MHNPISLTIMMMGVLSLGACASGALPPPTALGEPSAGTPIGRRAAIRAQLAPICGRPASDAELTTAADYVEAHRAELRAVAVVRTLSRLDTAVRTCRGQGRNMKGAGR